MKTGIIAAVLLFSLPISRVDAAPAVAKKAAHRTVVDYFRLLPARFFEIPNRGILLTKAYLPLIDLKNDYLKTGGDAAQPGLEIAVFRHRGRDLVAVSASYEVGYDFALLRLEKGGWKNVTNDLSPLVNNPKLRFVLPRHGTIIRVFQDNGKPLAKLYWENGSFSAESLDPSRHH